MSVEPLAVPGPKTCTDLDVRIGDRVRIARQRARLTQSALAAALNISFQQIQKYEKGRNRFSASSLQRVADLLGVPVASFYDEPGPVRVPPPLSVAEARAAQRAATEALEEAVRREAAAMQVAA
ncbi:helix-turn-helix domain-containing protein [Methylobacterium radiotolerans]|jgi:transcriptional regulator with XRE-family HTH domain|uniref:helix-turn-helix domain-containing protein n=1 Tax=Methylobacterium TaxID=407 RepID=UPI0005EA40D6|nr:MULTISPECIES: helix-turn-helix transcriptional regulator [Methylobacterium]MBN6821710.1 helix-turn-helix transcriptional regulator [Methylobacterium organophilum]MCY4376254.1 helix-turn-helix transcriptional regulator [Spirochaetaceae bacterium]OXE40297.1 transcriptional regulator [Methylobacterium radiotolerans]GAN49658.1 XRE family transcriptional regulator [Methylobacterium sp. ME121]